MKTSEALRELCASLAHIDSLVTDHACHVLPAHIEAVARMEDEIEAYRRDLGIFFDVPPKIPEAAERLRLACTQSQSRPVDPVVRPHFMVFANLNIAAFDEQGQQIPKLQVSAATLLAEHAGRCGYDVNGCVIETLEGNWKLFRTEDGGWNRELATDDRPK